MQNQSTGRKSGGRLRIKLEPPCCDQCRTNKVSCRAPESIEERCGQCEETNVACSWMLGPRPSGRSPPSPSYVSYLEAQVGKLERKLREILPGVNLNRELETLAQVAAPPQYPQPPTHSNPPPPIPASSHSAFLPSSPPRVQTIDSHGVSAAPQLLKQVRMASEIKLEADLPYSQPNQEHPPLRKDTYWSETASTRPKEPRYHGQSSGEILLRDAKELKQEFEELSLDAYDNKVHSNRAGPSASSHIANTAYSQWGPEANVPEPVFARPKPPRARIRQRRPEFWQPTPPEQRALARDVWAPGLSTTTDSTSEPELSEVVLPPPDLLRSLVELYFVHVNALFPIIHRQTFEQELSRGTHLLQVLQQRAQDVQHGTSTNIDYSDPKINQTRGGGTFARLVLLVCACASRFSSDPRVFSSSLAEETNEAKHRPPLLDAGYLFFWQVHPSGRTMCAQAGLWDVQIYILSAIYLLSSSTSYGAWIIVGIGIRLAQDIGAHRKKDENTIENEVYKRSFWALFALDRLISGTLGRPSAMQDLDTDLENPVEVDDEYWPIGGEPQQPIGKPSQISYFSCLIGLTRVLGRAQQTVFAIGRTKRQMGLIGAENEKVLLDDLQYHMKQWRSTVPPHLRPPHPDEFLSPIFFNQAVSLWALYYNSMILIHRPFITIKSSPLTAECLDICRSSARACARMIVGQIRSDGGESMISPQTINPAFSSAMVLLVDILATQNSTKGQRTSDAEDPYPMWEKEQDLERCIQVLAHAERKWHEAGRLHDIICEFRRSGKLPSSDANAQPKNPKSTSTNPVQPVSPWGTVLQPHAQSSASVAGSTPNNASSFPLNVTQSHAVGSKYVNSGISQRVGSSSSNRIATSSQYPVSTPFNHATPHQISMHHHNHMIDYTSPAPLDPAGLVHSSLPEPYHRQPGAYFPDASYGGNLNIPFPGIMPQLNFSPNQGRGNGYAGPANDAGTPDLEWLANAQQPTLASEWETMMNNTIGLARDSENM